MPHHSVLVSSDFNNIEFVILFAAKCIDLYIQNQCEKFEKPNENVEIDSRLIEIVDRMVKRCLDDGQYKQALGLGLEARRMDIFRDSITSSVSFT